MRWRHSPTVYFRLQAPGTAAVLFASTYVHFREYRCLHQTAPSYLAEEFHQYICWRGSSASPICFDIIDCCLTHPSFNHQRSSFSGRCCRTPTVEHSASERHVGAVNVCFQETFEDLSLQSFPLIRCSVIFLYLLTYVVWSDTKNLIRLTTAIANMRLLGHALALFGMSVTTSYSREH